MKGSNSKVLQVLSTRQCRALNVHKVEQTLRMLDFQVQCPAKTLRARDSTSKTMEMPQKCSEWFCLQAVARAIENKGFQGNMFFLRCLECLFFDPHWNILFWCLIFFLIPYPLQYSPWPWVDYPMVQYGSRNDGTSHLITEFYWILSMASPFTGLFRA